jgi:hypothetical protein
LVGLRFGPAVLFPLGAVLYRALPALQSLTGRHGIDVSSSPGCADEHAQIITDLGWYRPVAVLSFVVSQR